jgi:hypothetical protein
VNETMASFWGTKLHDKYVPLTPKQVIVIAAALFLVDTMGIIDVPFMDGQGIAASLMGESALDFVTDVPIPESEITDAVPVNVKIYCYEGFDVNTPGMAGTAADIIVRVYNAEMQLLEQATASSGTATLTRQYLSGSVLWLQARQGDVAAADPYVSPAVERKVFHSSSLEATDTVSVDPVYVRDVTATAPTIKVWDVGGAAISDNSANYFNTTDSTFTVQISAIDDDTWYGPEDFTDWKTGYVYDGGVFFVWKGTVAQPFDNYVYTWSDPTNVYYIFAVSNSLKDDTSVSSDDIVSVMLSTDGSALVADATVTLDIIDIIQIRAAGMSASDMIDGGGITPTAITTKVA